jgi:hypothetical protein
MFIDCLMIFNIELPCSLNKTRIGNWIRIRILAYDVRIRIQEAKNTDPTPYFLSLLKFYTPFRQIEVFAKTFREKLMKFCKNCDTFRKSFRFRERSKKCFRPNPSDSK